MDGHGATLAASPGPLRRKFLGWHNWLAYGPLVLGWWGSAVDRGQGAAVVVGGAGFWFAVDWYFLALRCPQFCAATLQLGSAFGCRKGGWMEVVGVV